MPTSSIFKNVIIDTPEQAEQLVDALEQSEKWAKEHHTPALNSVARYIKENSNGSNLPVSSSHIAAALYISRVDVRHSVNEARSLGIPICSCGKGYYYTTEATEIKKTIRSMQSRIENMSDAIRGLEQCV